MKVAVIQQDIITADLAANEQRVQSLLRSAAACGAQMAVLGEFWNSGFCAEGFEGIAQKIPGRSSELLRQLAGELDLWIFGGSIAEKKEGRLYNTSFLIDNKGEITQKYRKVHLFSGGNSESAYFAGGNEWALADTPLGKAGMIICFDLFFPELARNLALRGAKLLVVPAMWPAEYDEGWKTLLRARAIENSCFVVGCNRVGKDGVNSYLGGSQIIAPTGEVLLSVGNQEGAFCADLPEGLLEHAQKQATIPLRRRLLDEIDDNQL